MREVPRDRRRAIDSPLDVTIGGNLSISSVSRRAMFIRIAEVRLDPALADEARRIYAEQAAPRVQAVRGNAGCYMLEPVDEGAPHLACTVWDSEESARAYEQSGDAKEIAGLVRHAFVDAPRLRSYRKP
ncbi:MAG TPA: antibiotic biosynthesis monooxygenase [Polyangiaceae bacterium]